jgi:hypothetical protein
MAPQLFKYLPLYFNHKSIYFDPPFDLICEGYFFLHILQLNQTKSIPYQRCKHNQEKLSLFAVSTLLKNTTVAN